MNWAWEQEIPPSTKLVLLALADIADDTGYCWPSVKTIARKAGVSPRTVQRLLLELREPRQGGPALIRVVTRLDRKGSQRSNGYYLHMGGDKLSPAASASKSDARNVIPGVSESCHGEDDTVVTPRDDITASPLEPPFRTPKESKNRTTINSCGDKLLDACSQKRIASQIARLHKDEQENILTQLSKRMREGTIRNPASWVQAAVDRTLKSNGR